MFSWLVVLDLDQVEQAGQFDPGSVPQLLTGYISHQAESALVSHHWITRHAATSSILQIAVLSVLRLVAVLVHEFLPLAFLAVLLQIK